MRITPKRLQAIARLEQKAWKIHDKEVAPGLVMAILFAFCHRVITGQTVEEFMEATSTKSTQHIDYQI